MPMSAKDLSRAAIAVMLAPCLLTAAWGCAATTRDGATADGEADVDAEAPAEAEADGTEAHANALLKGCPVMREERFGGVYADITIDEFNAAGFEYGDALDVTFSNGYALGGIPYYSGYYVLPGEPLVVAYPGYPHIDVCVNFGDSLWDAAGLADGDTVDIQVSQAGAFSEVQDAFALAYPEEQGKGVSDEEFANWRALSGGRIKEGRAYRSASPVDDQHGRVAATNRLMRASRIRFVIDLADDEEGVGRLVAENGRARVDDGMFEGLWEGGSVRALGLDARFLDDGFRQGVAGALSEMAGSDGPCLIHCVEGKDRTGFVCALLEGLCGATYDEIAADYMGTYANYYGITEDGTPGRYESVRRLYLDEMLRGLAGVDGDADLATVDYEAAARRYLAEGGLDDGEIDSIVSYLCG